MGILDKKWNTFEGALCCGQNFYVAIFFDLGVIEFAVANDRFG